MTQPAGSPEFSGGAEPAWENLFPIELDSIVAVQHRLLQVTDDDVRSFIAVRRELGSANDPTTIMYGAGLSTWHMKHGDFTSDQAVQMYRTGKFYGAQMALDRYQTTTGHKLVADDLLAYDAARSTVLNSYRDIDAETQWQKDFLREQRFAGTTTLALLNALLHDHTLNQFHQVYGDDIPTDEALESFYTGLLDAAIFINTYASIKDHSRMPPRFDFAENKERARPAIYHLAKAAVNSTVMAAVQVEFEASDSEESLLLAATALAEAERTTNTAVLDGKPYYVESASVVRQVGPNSFRFVNEVVDIQEELPLTFRQRLVRIGGAALAGAAVSNVPEIWSSGSPATIVVGNIGGAIIGGIAGATLKYQRHPQLAPVWTTNEAEYANPLQKPTRPVRL